MPARCSVTVRARVFASVKTLALILLFACLLPSAQAQYGYGGSSYGSGYGGSGSYGGSWQLVPCDGDGKPLANSGASQDGSIPPFL